MGWGLRNQPTVNYEITRARIELMMRNFKVDVAHHIANDDGEEVGDDDDLTEVIVCMAHHIDSGMEV